MNAKKILILLIFLCCFLLCSCSESLPIDESESSEFQSFPKEPCFRSAGVVVYGYGKGWIQNKNEFLVRIQMVDQGSYDDETKWVLTFEAGQIKKVNANNSTYFHIYDIDGKPIGFIYPEKPR